MALIKRLTQLAQSAGTLVNAASAGAPKSLVLAPLRKLGWSVPFNPTPTAVKVYQAVISGKVALIDRLPSRYLEEAKDVVWNAVMKGYDVAGLARELHDRFGIVPDRAQLIADTQCKMARSVIENAQRIELGITEAKWQYDAERCKAQSHRALNGKRYPLVQGAKVDGKRIWPSSEPECFCASVPLDALEQGQKPAAGAIQ